MISSATTDSNRFLSFFSAVATGCENEENVEPLSFFSKLQNATTAMQAAEESEPGYGIENQPQNYVHDFDEMLYSAAGLVQQLSQQKYSNSHSLKEGGERGSLGVDDGNEGDLGDFYDHDELERNQQQALESLAAAYATNAVYTATNATSLHSPHLQVSKQQRSDTTAEGGAASDDHKENEDVACPECDGVFKNKPSLASHLKTHNTERRKYACSTCKSSFSRNHGMYKF